MKREVKWKIARMSTRKLNAFRKKLRRILDELEEQEDFLKQKLALTCIAIDRIGDLYFETKYQIGKRKSEKCKLLKWTADGEWMCPARLKKEYSSRKLFQEENCCWCKLSPEQARLKATMNKILGLKPE